MDVSSNIQNDWKGLLLKRDRKTLALVERYILITPSSLNYWHSIQEYTTKDKKPISSYDIQSADIVLYPQYRSVTFNLANNNYILEIRCGSEEQYLSLLQIFSDKVIRSETEFPLLTCEDYGNFKNLILFLLKSPCHEQVLNNILTPFYFSVGVLDQYLSR
jgi:hypothetical protein